MGNGDRRRTRPATTRASASLPIAPPAAMAIGVTALTRACERLRRARSPADRSRADDIAPGGAPWDPSPTNLELRGGAVTDAAQLCAPIERGIYVTRLWYVNTVRDKETLLTDMTREGTFLIEDGQISRPLRDVVDEP